MVTFMTSLSVLYQEVRDNVNDQDEVTKKKKQEESDAMKQYQNMFAGHDRRKVIRSLIELEFDI